MKKFSNRLKFSASLAGGQDVLAQRIGVTLRTFANYIAGKTEPKVSDLVAVANSTGISIEWLATGEGPLRKGEEEKEVILAQTVDADVGGGRSGQQRPRARVTPVPQIPKDADPAFAIRAYAEEAEHLNAEVERFKAQSFWGAQREAEDGKREIGVLKWQVAMLQEMAALKEMVKQPPPPPTAGGGVADITLLGLAECGFAGWLLKKPLSVNVICPVGMNPAEDFAVMATGQSLFYAGIEPGFVCFCATKSTPRVGDIVYVLKPNNMASLGLVRELEQKEKGSETPWLVLQKWHDLDPKTGLREPYTLRENRDELEEIVPVIYVQRRPI